MIYVICKSRNFLDLSIYIQYLRPTLTFVIRSGTILGFKPDQAKDSVSGNARLAVIRGHAARQTYRGVLGNPKVVEGASTIPTQPAPADAKSGQKAAADEKVTKEVVSSAADAVPPAAEKEAVGSKRKRAAEQEAPKRKKK